MHSSADNHLPIEQIAQLKTLLHCDKLAILAKSGGGNSKVFCAEADGKKWAIKSYPPYAPNQRDRLVAETTTYQFLNQHQVPAVPEFQQSCSKTRLLIIDWIDGTIPNQYNKSDIEQAIQFIREIAKLNTLPSAQSLPLAAEACLSLDILIKQIFQRLERLQNHQGNEPLLKDFLQNQLLPLLQQVSANAIFGYKENSIDPNVELAVQYRSLIPADFGFHNSLRDETGKLYFFDFDYFGWDDPVKLLADILWHPKMLLSSAQQHDFVNGITNAYQNDDQFSLRFKYTYPLFGLRWALILLNEFIPDFWQNRQHAEAHQDQQQAKQQQLSRANTLLNKIYMSLQSNDLMMNRRSITC